MIVPFRRVADLGAQVVATPIRVLELLAEPVRDDLRRDVRASLGAPGRPAQPVMDPDRAYLDPGGIARQVHGDLPAMVIGGLAALLLQTLHPLAMAGVAQHSNYKEDALGRLRRTAAFVGFTTFGSTEEAQRAIEKVRQVHLHVRGIAPDGRPYSASDPELVTWIHAAEMSSFVRAAQRFGPRRLTREEVDHYLVETAPLAYELGAEWVPRSAAELASYFLRMRPELYAGPQTLEARDFLLRGVARRPQDQMVYALVATGAVSVLPPWARRQLAIPLLPPLDAATRPVLRTFCGALRWAIRDDA